MKSFKILSMEVSVNKDLIINIILLSIAIILLIIYIIYVYIDEKKKLNKRKLFKYTIY